MSLDPAPSILVIDCEGAEAEALVGCQKTLRGVKTAFIETHRTLDGYDSKPDTKRILEDNGFSITDDGEWIIGRRVSGSL
jgi:hypothetical protein